jgi:hypothetical protein
VIGGLAAPRRQPRTERRRRAKAPRDVEVDVTRATVVDATPLSEPDAWLEASGEEVEATALAVLARAVAARRVAAADPWLPDPDPDRALVTRIGYGPGEAVADGEWTVAREIEKARGKGGRRRILEPQERVAALLSGRDVALACEELALRARADLDRGRGREAAIQLDAALRAALAELEGWREHRDLAARIAELDGHLAAVRAAADAALHGGLDDTQLASVREVLPRLEAALRARAAHA